VVLLGLFAPFSFAPKDWCVLGYLFYQLEFANEGVSILDSLEDFGIHEQMAVRKTPLIIQDKEHHKALETSLHSGIELESSDVK